jgi:PTH1 family peptidyl-tRNA hydrolase
MKLIVGLGNPGPKYALTRHNIGFLAIDAFVEVFGSPSWKSEHKALTCKIRMGSEVVLAAKPQTFMNLSGEAVQSLMSFYSLSREDLLVVHDDIDQTFGHIKFHIRRGHGGHNGIRNIHQLLGDDYARLKLGVSRPPNIVDDDGKVRGPMMDVADWVLQNFSKDEMSHLPDFIERGTQAIRFFIENGFERAANQFNGKG